jgi:signal transduction histidine kinase
MLFRDIPIQKKLMAVFLVMSTLVLVLTCVSFLASEIFTFRKTTASQLSTLGKIIAANSTAALAFDSPEDAGRVLSALETEPHIRRAAIYDAGGRLFAHYPDTAAAGDFPPEPGQNGYRFTRSGLSGFQAITYNNRSMGTLYLQSDLDAIYDRLKLYFCIMAVIIVITLAAAYMIARRLQKSISLPILSLAETAKIVSESQDYSVRAAKFGKDELGSFTDLFNGMLMRIQDQSQEIILFNQQLEQKVIDRTVQLEAVNHELEAFSYSISHDLRAPLRAINGYTRILHEDYFTLFDDEGRRLLSVVQENAKKMGMLIDDLLAFSKLGRKELAGKTLVDMTQLSEKALAEVNKSMPNNAEVTIFPLHPALADELLISQVLFNLLSNAVKYSSHKTDPVIELHSYKEDNEIIYSVRDNGAGFDNAYVGKLFGVFQRLHSDSEFEGTGVGLALVKRIVMKHGGRTWASGEVGKGAVFYFSLPDSNLIYDDGTQNTS